MRSTRGPLLAVFACALGVAAGWALRDRPAPIPILIAPATDVPLPGLDRAVRRPGVRFTRPLLDCRTLGSPRAVAAIGAAVDATVDEITAAGPVATVAVFYRDLESGSEVARDADERFKPASLLKLMSLIALLRQEERAPGFSSLMVRVPPPTPEQETTHLEIGAPYSLGELARVAILHSDNLAAHLVSSQLPQDALRTAFVIHGLPYPPESRRGDLMSPREYAGVLTALFNASDLLEVHAEFALGLLSRSTFGAALSAGVPDGVPVAHKYGVWAATAAGEQHQLHDCGILYPEGGPYVLCVMTRGTDLGAQVDAVKRVSRAVHTARRQFGHAPAPPATGLVR